MKSTAAKQIEEAVEAIPRDLAAEYAREDMGLVKFAGEYYVPDEHLFEARVPPREVLLGAVDRVMTSVMVEMGRKRRVAGTPIVRLRHIDPDNAYPGERPFGVKVQVEVPAMRVTTTPKENLIEEVVQARAVMSMALDHLARMASVRSSHRHEILEVQKLLKAYLTTRTSAVPPCPTT